MWNTKNFLMRTHLKSSEDDLPGIPAFDTSAVRKRKPNETPYKSVMLSETPEGLDAQAMQIIASAIQACGKFQFKSDLYKPQVYADFQLVDYTLISSALPSAESWR